MAIVVPEGSGTWLSWGRGSVIVLVNAHTNLCGVIILRLPRKAVGVLTPVVQLEFKERCAEPSPALIH